jgi:post-segregation antitoxin (ccd killing protein)
VQPAPTLWILAAGTPASLIAELRPVPVPGWPRGVYAVGGEVLRLRLVAASELPRERSTLLVRLMAAGALLPRAVAELSELPRGAAERAVADQILLRLRHALERAPKRSPLEEEFIVTMYKTWDDARDEGREEGLKRGLKKGEREGRVKAQAEAILTVLRARGIPVSKAARERIQAEQDRARLKHWLERAAVARSVTAVLRDRS